MSVCLLKLHREALDFFVSKQEIQCGISSEPKTKRLRPKTGEKQTEQISQKKTTTTSKPLQTGVPLIRKDTESEYKYDIGSSKKINTSGVNYNNI